MLSIAIVDDDMYICSHLYEYIERAMNSYSLDIDEFDSGIYFVNALEDGTHYDIVFMDIQMAPIDGVEAGKILRATEHGGSTILIYISAYTDNLMPLFALEPLDFIEKPLEYGSFAATARKILARLESDKQHIFVKVGRDELRLPLADIIYAEIIGGRQVKLHTVSGNNLITYERMSALIDRISTMSAAILQIHKSYFINKNHILSFNNHEVTMSDNTKLPISASFRASVNKALMNSLVDGGIFDEF